jgi:hypothetical protein
LWTVAFLSRGGSAQDLSFVLVSKFHEHATNNR